jgi:hypothetical protein
MIYLIQLMRMLEKDQRQLFVALFDDLSFEINEQGYLGLETELVSDILGNHFGIEFECPNQLKMLTDCILRHHNKMADAVRRAVMYAEIKAGA